MILGEKQMLRKSIRARLSHMLPETRAAASAALRTHLQEWERFAEAKDIFGFFPLKDEPEWLAEDFFLNKRLWFPRIEGSNLHFHAVDKIEELSLGTLGIHEPSAKEARCQADIILVPGVAFDAQGGRLGRGRGFYDTFLPSATGFRLGVCFSEQVVPAIPMEPHDCRMDALLTPEGIISCRQPGIPR